MLARMINGLRHRLRSWFPPQEEKPLPPTGPASPSLAFQPITELCLQEGVRDTLFSEYAAHRAGPRGEEETGWVLLGYRHSQNAIAVATLPAGDNRDAGVTHVRFSGDAQALACRLLRMQDKKLTILGIVHTHPGGLRRPSGGDYRGDIEWVAQLKGREGAFGIGTADGPLGNESDHQICQNELCFSWYTLGVGDEDYRRLPIRVVSGQDRAKQFHSKWPILEAHAGPLERLFQQLKTIRYAIVDSGDDCGLQLSIPLAGGPEEIRVALGENHVEYYLIQNGEWYRSDRGDHSVDNGVFLILARWAEQREEAGYGFSSSG